MRDYVAEHFARHPGPVRPHIVTKRGLPLSVQASSFHYCSPREDDAPRYGAVEVWWSGRTPRPLRQYQSYSSEPAGWVPVSVVNQLIARRGGLADD